jgi:hypothetical protein
MALATAASAAPVTVFKQNNGDTFNGGGKLHVTVSTPAANAMAGGFRLQAAVGDPFVAWCLDIMNNLSIPAAGREYTITGTPFGATSGLLDATARANVEGLFQTAYGAVDINDNTQSAGYQMALWEVLYETDATFDLTSGSFQQVKTGAAQDAAEAAANSFLALLEGGVVTQAYAFSYYESATDAAGKQLSQNLVSVAEVPLPAGAWLLGLGLAGLYGARRRKTA